MPDSPVSALSFDAAGTLIHLAEPVGASYSRVAARHGIEADPAELEQVFRRVWKRTPSPFSPDFDTEHPDEKSWWRELVAAVFGVAVPASIGTERFGEFFEDLYDHFEMPGTWVTDEETHRCVAAVAERFPCIVLSNFDERLRRILRDLELLPYFDTVILSCEERASKPDPRMFASASRALWKPAGEILHVGDDPVCDWEGARSAGFGCYRIEEGSRSLPGLLRQLSLA